MREVTQTIVCLCLLALPAAASQSNKTINGTANVSIDKVGRVHGRSRYKTPITSQITCSSSRPNARLGALLRAGENASRFFLICRFDLVAGS